MDGSETIVFSFLGPGLREGISGFQFSDLPSTTNLSAYPWRTLKASDFFPAPLSCYGSSVVAKSLKHMQKISPFEGWKKILQNYKGGNIQKTFTKFLIVSDKLEIFVHHAGQKCTL